jgi:hypothetical protein
MRCPTGSGLAYWMETAYKLGTHTAQDHYDQNGWALIQKFDAFGSFPDGNGNAWTQYTGSVSTSVNTTISIGYLTGTMSNGPIVQWDTFDLE